MRCLQPLVWFASAMVLALVAGNASALSYIMMRDADLFDQSEGVLTATVIRRLPAQDGDLETIYELSVDSVLAGPKLGKRRTLALPGTVDAPNLNMLVHGIPVLAEGAELLLFYGRRPDGTLQPIQLTLGLFGKQASSRGDVYVRHLEKSGDLSKIAERDRYHALRDVPGFERWVRDRARNVSRPPDYLLEGVELGRSKFAFGNFQGPPVAPGRWFQFDTDQSLEWRANSGGQAGVGVASFTMLTNALAGWINDPTSRIVMNNSGTFDYASRDAFAATCSVFTNGTSSSGCFAAHVFWNDPDGLIPGSFCGNGCTLAIGGSFASSSLMGQFDGAPWYRRILGFVIIQDGAGVGTMMNGNGGADGTELLTHEVGHVIGFAHSCESGSNCVAGSLQDMATMRSAIHRDGRGSSLGADDIAGAAVIYPMPAASGSCGVDCVHRNGFEGS